MEQKKGRRVKERKINYFRAAILIICTVLMIISGIKIIK